MNRREAISAVSIIFGGTIIGAEAFISGCSPKRQQETGEFLTTHQIQLLDEIGETILPATGTSPGAKDAKVGEFMKIIVRDCYSTEEQQVFLRGIHKIDEVSQEKFGSSFIKLADKEKFELLIFLEEEAKKNQDEPHYYSMFKQLTIWGFVSSEPGATKSFRHVDVPGRYDACIPLEVGGKAWV